MGGALSLPAIFLGPNYGGGNEDNGDLLQKIPCMNCYTQWSQPCSSPPPTHTSTGDSWPLPGKSGSVSCGVTAPFSWVLVHTTFCLCPPSVNFPGLCKFWQLCGGINGGILQESLCHTQVCCTQSPCPCGSPLLTHISIGQAQTALSQSLRGPWVLVRPRFVRTLWASLEGMGFELDSPTIFWDFSFAPGHGVPPHSHSSASQLLLQCLPSCWGFSDPGRAVSPHEVTGVSPHEVTKLLHFSEVTGQSLRQSLRRPELPPNSLIIILT